MIRLMVLLVILVMVLLILSCAGSGPCIYDGKLVPRSDALRMKNLGMAVSCPEDR